VSSAWRAAAYSSPRLASTWCELSCGSDGRHGEHTALHRAGHHRHGQDNAGCHGEPGGQLPRSLSGYEESRSIDLVSDDDPNQLLRLSLYEPGRGTTIDSLVEENTVEENPFFASPAEPVMIQGKPGWLALTNGDFGDPDYWYTVGQLPEGQILLLAPQTLTREQVLQIAEQVSYTQSCSPSRGSNSSETSVVMIHLPSLVYIRPPSLDAS
jgi:hypothetical protein